jgi:hypothetical protein
MLLLVSKEGRASAVAIPADSAQAAATANTRTRILIVPVLLDETTGCHAE